MATAAVAQQHHRPQYYHHTNNNKSRTNKVNCRNNLQSFRPKSHKTSSIPNKDATFMGADGIYRSELFAGPACSNSPPPSSLPIPNFSLRPNRRVPLEPLPAVVDSRATENLRRILNL